MKRSLLSALIFAIVLIIAGVLYIRYGALLTRALKALQKSETVKDFPFNEENALKEWEEKIFKGKVVYRIEKGQTLSYVRATSNKTASALYYKIKLDAKKRDPVISWKWNVDKFPEKKIGESLETENEDDFAARVYVIFPAIFFTNSKVLEYIWAETLPEGMIGTSPYSKNIKLIVTRSGPNKDKKWFQEDRDITADYMKAFGAKPEYNIGAVAFMTNTEHTLTSADAMYDEIKLGYKE
ncbi:MAG: DUF3047 domain-containing protein [Candidatus Omnitrophota bacterium]|nr:DUF3047 domain-containing protein [Candidatus Omnitrophota bacterium]